MDDGLIRGLLSDPVRLRRPGRWLGLAFALFSGLSYLLLGRGFLALAYGLTWLALPFIAALRGYGEAFFLEHGVGIRRAVLQLAGGMLAVLTACIILSFAGLDGRGVVRTALTAAAAAALYLGAFYGLSAGVALGLGRGLDYAGRGIEALDEEGW